MSARFENDPEFNDATPKPTGGRGFILGDVGAALGRGLARVVGFLIILALLAALLLPFSRSSRARRSGPCAPTT